MWRGVIPAACMLIVGAAPAGALPAPPADAGPLRLLARERLDPRLEQLSFRTPAVSGITRVRILLPAGYDAQRQRRYPVLYLLHGAIDDYASWTAKGRAEQITARYPLIVVMPDSGASGGYANWYNGGKGGPPAWETYHLGELLPWVDAHLRTRAARRAGDRGAFDGRLWRDQLRGSPPGSVRRRGELLRRR